jgi:anti-sigma28 factor (negative regulator of flagellin synthesis)
MYSGDDQEKSLKLPHDRRIARAMLRKLRQSGDARQAKVDAIRRAIASGDYENALKVSVTIERVIEEL